MHTNYLAAHGKINAVSARFTTSDTIIINSEKLFNKSYPI